MQRFAVIVSALALLGVLGPISPAQAGPISPCVGTTCTVANEAELLQALTELSGSTTGLSRINLTADIVLSPSTSPFYDGTQELLLDGKGFGIDGNDNAQLLQHSTSAALSLTDITMKDGLASSGKAVIDALGEVTVNDSTISGNLSENTADVRGGAISSNGAVGIFDSQITDNTARALPGAASGGAVNADGDVVIMNSTVTGNTADGQSQGQGGAVFTLGEVDIQNSTVSDNDATGSSAKGGAASTNGANGAIEVVDTEMEGNRATSSSSGAVGGALNSDVGVTVTRSVLDGNEAVGAQAAIGGAINTNGGDITIADSLVVENASRANSSGARGGALASAAGGAVEIAGSTLRDNNAISGASNTSGGAVYAISGTVLVQDSAIVRNAAQGSTGIGGGIFGPNSPISIFDSTVAGNIAQTGAGLDSNMNIDLRFATVVDNATPTSGQVVTSGTLFAAATVIAKPSGALATNCDGLAGTVSQVANYEDDHDPSPTCGFGAGSGDVSGGPDPLLGPARDNGGARLGPTELTPGPRARLSAFPLQGSPLIDVLGPLDCTLAANANPVFLDDQRGVDRPAGAACDIGAIEAVFPPHGFTDVTPFYENTVRWVTSDVNTPQILLGFPDNTFGHTLNITRGQAARLYYRAAGAPDVSLFPPHGFTDVTPFFDDAVTWTKGLGIFDGFPDNTFRQNNPISRGNYTRSLYNFAGTADISTLPAHGFTDVTPFYDDAVTWIKGHGLADGFGDNTYRQDNNINRGNASRTAYNTAQTPAAWDLGGIAAPPNMLFKENID